MAKKYKVLQAVNEIKQAKPNFTPKIAVILGSGLGAFAEQLQDKTVIPYGDIPHFPGESGVAGHAGNLVLGTLHKVPIACLQGRLHIYEGFSPETLKVLIRTLRLLGCKVLFITCAAGSLRKEVTPGELMLITDHINFQFTNVLIGANDDEFGPRFVNMDNAYDKKLCAGVMQAAAKLKLKLARGVYLATSGPCFETPAEIEFFKTIGADAVGMSTIQEVILARHCGMKIAAVAAITNLAAGMSKVKLSHEQTLKGAKLGSQKLIDLLAAFVKEYR